MLYSRIIDLFNMNFPILSICIPTYNRADLLKGLLNNIVAQSGDFDFVNKVEIVISDNNSSDQTSSLVAEYQGVYPNIIYSRNEKNLLFDRNVYNVIKMSTGKYCWLLGDDDLICHGFLSFLVKYHFHHFLCSIFL